MARTGNPAEAEQRAYGRRVSKMQRVRIKRSPVVRESMIETLGLIMETSGINTQNIITKMETVLDMIIEKLPDATPQEVATLLKPFIKIMDMFGGDWAKLSNAHKAGQGSLAGIFLGQREIIEQHLDSGDNNKQLEAANEVRSD